MIIFESTHKTMDMNKELAKYVGYVYIPFNELPHVNDIKYDLRESQKEFAGWRHKDSWLLHYNNEMPKIGIIDWLCRSHNDLKFHESWDWIMHVWEKYRQENENNNNKEQYIIIKNQLSTAFLDCDILTFNEILYKAITNNEASIDQ